MARATMSTRTRLLVAATLALAACAGLLGLRRPGGHAFEHRAHVTRGVSCLDCHRGVDRAGETGPLHLPVDADCLACHARPHDTRSCLGCHGTAWTAHDLVQAREHLRFSHDEHVAELKGNCVRCHVDVREEGAPLRARMATCLGCHEHQDEWRTRDCGGCHVDLEREGSTPASHIVHEGDFLREHGVRAAAESDLCQSCHAERFCASCHGASAPALPARLAFDDPGTASVHRAGFVSRHSEEAAAQPGLCSACHSTRSCVGCHDQRGVFLLCKKVWKV
jgi:hypothetical protein